MNYARSSKHHVFSYSQKLLKLLILVTIMLSDSVIVMSETNGYKVKTPTTDEWSSEKKGVYRLIDILRPVRAKRQLDEGGGEGGGGFFFPYDLYEGEDYEGSRDNPNGRDPHETDTTTTTITSTTKATTTQRNTEKAEENNTRTIDQMITTDLITTVTPNISQSIFPNLTHPTTKEYTTTERTEQATTFPGINHTLPTPPEIQDHTTSSGEYHTPGSDEETESQSESVVYLTVDEAEDLNNKSRSTTTSASLTSPHLTVVPTEYTTVSNPLTTGITTSIVHEEDQQLASTMSSTDPEVSTVTYSNQVETGAKVTPSEKPLTQVTQQQHLPGDSNDTVTSDTTTNKYITSPADDRISVSGSSMHSNSHTISPESQSLSDTSSSHGFHPELSTRSPSPSDIEEPFASESVSAQTITESSVFTTDYGSSSEFPFSGEQLSGEGSDEASGEEDILHYTSSSVLTTVPSDPNQGCFNCGEMKIMMEEFAELKRQNYQLQLTLLELSNSIDSNAKKIEASTESTKELVKHLQQNVSHGQGDMQDTLVSLLGGMEGRLIDKIENLTQQTDATEQRVSDQSVDTVSSVSSVSDLSQCVYHTSNNQSSTNSSETSTDWRQTNIIQTGDTPSMKVSNAYCATYGGTRSVLHRLQDNQHWLYRCVCSGKLLDSAQRFCELHIWECPF